MNATTEITATAWVPPSSPPTTTAHGQGGLADHIWRVIVGAGTVESPLAPAGRAPDPVTGPPTSAPSAQAEAGLSLIGP